jgi:phospholipase C
MDCSVSYATPANPSGCRGDLWPWVEMGFYNVQQGDIPYLKGLADQYTILDNYHRPRGAPVSTASTSASPTRSGTATAPAIP